MSFLHRAMFTFSRPRNLYSAILILSFICFIFICVPFFNRTIIHAECPIYYKSKNPPYVVHSPLRLQIENQEQNFQVLSSKLMRLHYLSEDLSAQLFKSSLYMVKDELLKTYREDLVREVTSRSNVIQLEIESLMKQMKIDKRKENEADDLQRTILTEITKLQNPHNCSEVRYLWCKVTKDFGFAAGIHDILWCFVHAYYTSRTVIMDLQFHYFKHESWIKLFEPISELDNLCVSTFNLEENKKAGNVIVEDIFKPNDPYFRQFLGFLPKEYSSRISAISNDPIAWFHSAFIKYIMRPSKYLNSLLDKTKGSLNFHGPIVGVHIRRSDKLTKEANKHDVSEYMDHVIDFYRKKELTDGPIEEKKIYVATDDPSAIDELTSKYSSFTVLSNKKVAEDAASLDSRYSTSSLYGIVIDLMLLGQTDIVIGTYSSGVSRLAMELKIANNPNTINPGISLDVPFHFDLIFNPPHLSLYHYQSKKGSEEWSLEPGDKVYELEAAKGFDWWSQARDNKVYPGYIRASGFNQSEHKYFHVFLTAQEIPIQ